MISKMNDLIRELRKRTSVSIVKCKQALLESNGDIELAIDNIKKLGLKIDLNKSNRSTAAGLIAAKISSDNDIGLMLEINCETDFVAKNHIFQKFANMILTTAFNEEINDIDTLKMRFENQRSTLINQFGENIRIHRFIVLTGDFLTAYLHGLKIGVMVSASGKINYNIIKQIAMHIAARNPKYINVSDISSDLMTRERHIQMDIAIRSGKSQKVIEKIVEGRMDKFINEVVLIKQDFIMDTNETVESTLEKYQIKINSFERFEIGDD